MTCRVVVLISGNGSNLQALIDNAGTDYQVVAVISNRPQAYGLVRAQQAGIDTRVLRHQEYADRDVFDSALMQAIDHYAPDLVTLAGFMRILTSPFVQNFHGRMINIHPSLLPRFQGLDTHRRALDAKAEKHGCSVHFVTEELDGGPIILQASTAILPEDTVSSLSERVHALEHRVYPLTVRWFAQGRLRLDRQHVILDHTALPQSGYTYKDD